MASTVQHMPSRGGALPRYSTSGLFVLSWAIVAGFFGIIWAAHPDGGFNVVGTIVLGTILWAVAVWAISYLVEGGRKATDRFVTTLVIAAFGLALIPLISLLYTTVANGLARFDVPFFTESMRNVIGAGGGALHAIVGTALITLTATIISVPIGLMSAVYLVEYGRGNGMAKAITFLVDVMTGIPSIVAGLFAFALFSLILNDPGVRFGLGGGVALSILMIPTIVRSSEEMLRLVPDELREASYALGVPKWLTITRIVLPTSLAGIVTGVMLGIARVAGETAPLLLIAGFTTSMNYNIFSERMMTLPVFVYYQFAVPGISVQASMDRAWTGALVLILLVMILNLGARLVARLFSPKLSR